MAKLTKAQKGAMVSVVIDRMMNGQFGERADTMQARADDGEHCAHVAAYCARLADDFWRSAHRNRVWIETGVWPKFIGQCLIPPSS